MDKLVPFDMNPDEPWFIAHDVFAAGGDTTAALHALRTAEEIVARTAAGLTEAWREAYRASRPFARRRTAA